MIDYESMCLSPRETIKNLLEFTGLNDLQSIQWLDAYTVQPGNNYHSLNGNPDRFDGGPLRITARAPDWSKYTLPDRLSSQFIGRALSTLYRPVTQKPAEAVRCPQKCSSGNAPTPKHD
jgi:hypothetical protein